MTNFWGLQLTKGLRYTKVVKQPFRISCAVLDTKTCVEDDIISVMFEDNNVQYVLCNLSVQNNILQCPLDLQFCEGDTICFSLRGGHGDVFLTGYNLVDDDFEDEEESSEDEEVDYSGLMGIDEDDEDEDDKDDDHEHSDDEDDSDDDEEPPQLLKMKRKRDVIETPKSAKKDSKKAKLDQSKNEAEAKSTQEKTLPKKKKRKEKRAAKSNNGLSEDKKSKTLVDLMHGEDEADSEDDDDFTMEGIEFSSDEESDAVDIESDEEEEEEEKPTKSKAKKIASATPSSAVKTPTTKSGKKAKKEESPTQQKTPVALKQKTPNTLKPKTPIAAVQAQDTPKSKKKKTKENKENEKTPNKETPKTPQSQIKKIVKAGGVVCEDSKLGSGSEAKNGKMVSVYYEGRLRNGKVFDKVKSGPNFKFRLGSNEVIRAWDIGIQGMKVGGKRTISAPPNMAYGKSGAPPDIPPNSFLIFDVELRAVS